MVIDVLRLCENPDIKILGGELDNLKGARNRADYDLEKQDVEDVKTAELYLQRAAKLVEKFSGFTNNAIQWSDLCEAVEFYRKNNLRK